MRIQAILPLLALSIAACEDATGPSDSAAGIPETPAGSGPEEPESAPPETEFLAIVVDDPRGDNTGPSDVDIMRLSYNKYTGEYRITIVAYPEAPFRDSLRVNINLLNPDLGTQRYPAFFSDTMNDIMLANPTTELVLEGVDPRLTAWIEGHHVYPNSLGGTPNPDGASVYRSGVTHFPMGFLTNEDVIAFDPPSTPAVIEQAQGLN